MVHGWLVPCPDKDAMLHCNILKAWFDNVRESTLTDKGLKCHTSDWTSRNCSSAALSPAVLYEHHWHDRDGFGGHGIHCQLQVDKISPNFYSCFQWCGDMRLCPTINEVKQGGAVQVLGWVTIWGTMAPGMDD